jgi:hypothetical protein
LRHSLDEAAEAFLALTKGLFGADNAGLLDGEDGVLGPDDIAIPDGRD